VIEVAVRLPLARLTRTRAWIIPAVWLAFAVTAAALLARAGGMQRGASVLEPWVGGVAIPFLAFAVVRAVLGGDGLAHATRPLTILGASPVRTAGALAAVGIAVSAVACGFAGLAAALATHGPADPPLAGDALATTWVCALGGAAYAALFVLGGAFGKHGGGRALAFGLDWVLGQEGTATAPVTPRAHLRSLLGGPAIESLPGRASALLLLVLAFAFALLAVVRARRPQS
jgi:hypothetical protein